MKKSQSATLTWMLVLFVSACNAISCGTVCCEGNITFNIHLGDYQR